MSSPLQATRTGLVLEFLLVLVVFVVFAGTLVPEINEPNYLAKAKHYWDPAWCNQDFFLQTADVHTVFYWVFGWLTLFLPLPAVAWVGRLVTCGLLAYGWQKISRAMSLPLGFAIVSAALLLTLNTYFHMAGEWVAGGFEAKGFAYGFVFLALAALLGNQWNRTWILLGIAGAFHILVGGWACIVATFAWCVLGKNSLRPSLRSQIPGFVTGGIISIAGAWPAMALARDTTAAVAQRAAEIQVFYRLPHHLAPGNFFFLDQPPYLTMFAIRFLALALIWFTFAATQRENIVLRRLNAFTLGALVVAAVGIAISLCTESHPTLAARLLRYYWFRLADVILPASVALNLVVRIVPLLIYRPTLARAAIAITTILLISLPIREQYLAGGVPAADRIISSSPKRWQQWKAACAFARKQTRADALFLTPKHTHTFKWYANRAEVATWKEMPQDAVAVIDWRDRIETLYPATPEPGNSLAKRSPQELLAIARRYGANYLVTESSPVLDLPSVYQNDCFVIYSLQEAGAGKP